MRYCPKCGAECNDEDLFCSACGSHLEKTQIKYNNDVSNEASNEDQARTLGIVSIVLAVVGMGIIGLILAIIGLKRSTNDSAKGLCLAGIIVCSIEIIIGIIVLILVVTGVIAGFAYVANGF